MAKYLFQVSYTAQGAKGLLEGGGSKRRAAAEQAAKSVGGRIESFYFAFGDADAFVIADIPDHASASAVSRSRAACSAAVPRSPARISALPPSATTVVKRGLLRCSRL